MQEDRADDVRMVDEDVLVHKRDKSKATKSLVIGVTMAVVGASFQYGYNIAVVNAPADEIQDFYFPMPKELQNCTQNKTDILNATTSNITALNTNTSVNESSSSQKCGGDRTDYDSYRWDMWSLAVSVFAAAGMIGSLLVGPVVRKFGRRGGLMVNNAISIVAALCLGLAKPANSYALIVIGRVFIGVFAGLATGIVPMYISEISPKIWRGAIGVLNQLLITIGILVAQLLGLGGALGTDERWPYLLAFTCIPSILSLISFPLMPKSPRFLLIDQKKENEAKEALKKLRGTENVDDEMDEMRMEAAEQTAAGQLSILQLFRNRSIRWQLITVLLMMTAQQLSGINAVFFYTNIVFDSAGIPKGNPQDLASVAVGTVNVIMTIVSVGIIERVGRKALMVWGFGMMIFWCLALTVILNVLLNFKGVGWISYLSIGCVIGYIVGFAIGPGPIPWLITAELFRQAARPPAFMVACLVNWTCNFIVGISFPAVAKLTGPYVFIGFMVVCIFITIFLALGLPETKGKTFQEINNLFAKRNKLPQTSVEDPSSQTIPLKVMSGSGEQL